MTSWPRAGSRFSSTVLLTSHYHLQGKLDVTFGGPGPRGRRGRRLGGWTLTSQAAECALTVISLVFMMTQQHHCVWL